MLQEDNITSMKDFLDCLVAIDTYLVSADDNLDEYEVAEDEIDSARSLLKYAINFVDTKDDR